MNVSSTVPVSVVIPTYNRANIVSEAIDSVLAQTYKNYEIIVVDDGSEDDTKTVLKKRYNDHIRYIYQPNKGPSAARNRGIHESKYDLIAFLDSDDLWLSKKLEMQVSVMLDSNVVLSYTNWIYKDNSKTNAFSEIGLNPEQQVTIIEHPMNLVAQPGKMGILIQTCICRKEVLYRIGLFDERMKIAEDTRAIYRLAMEGKFAAILESLLLRDPPSTDNHLTKANSLEYLIEHTNAVVEILMESYAHSIKDNIYTQTLLRNKLSFFLSNQAKYCAQLGNFRLSRRKALESLAFLPRGKTALKALLTLLCPQALHSLKKRMD